MVKRILKLATLALSLAVLSSLYGCATGANSGAMSISPADMPTSANAELKGKAGVRYVGGGKETNPMLASQVDSNAFKTALSQSLRVAGYESSGVPTYFVDAELQALSQPMFGLTFDVTSTVRYTVEGQGKRKIFPITAVGTATTSEAFAAVERLRIANEKSIKENIKKFLNELSLGL
jgi:hypothetical protein